MTFSPSRTRESLRRLQRGQPCANVDRTRLRRSEPALQAAQRDGGRSAAATRSSRERSKPALAAAHPTARRSAGMRACSSPRTTRTSSSSRRRKPDSATSRISARPVARASRLARADASGRARVGAGYTFLAATYQSAETVDGSSNSTNDAAQSGARGLEGTIDIEPGDRIADGSAPHDESVCGRGRHVDGWRSIWISIAVSSSYARGNENNRHQPDGTITWAPARRPATASSISGGDTGSCAGLRSSGS